MRKNLDVYALVAYNQHRQQAVTEESQYRVLDKNGEHTIFVGTLEECNAKFGDSDVSFVPVSGGGN